MIKIHWISTNFRLSLYIFDENQIDFDQILTKNVDYNIVKNGGNPLYIFGCVSTSKLFDVLRFQNRLRQQYVLICEAATAYDLLICYLFKKIVAVSKSMASTIHAGYDYQTTVNV